MECEKTVPTSLRMDRKQCVQYATRCMKILPVKIGLMFHLQRVVAHEDTGLFTCDYCWILNLNKYDEYHIPDDVTLHNHRCGNLKSYPNMVRQLTQGMG
jgi:hypothetical protein